MYVWPRIAVENGAREIMLILYISQVNILKKRLKRLAKRFQ